MKNYSDYASHLQSRIAKRANEITLNVLWKKGYRALSRMQDWRDSKDVLKELEAEQRVDKKLLAIVRYVPQLEDHTCELEEAYDTLLGEFEWVHNV